MADLILHRKPQREFPREDAASGKSFSYFKPSEIASVAILIFFMCGWHWRVTGALNAAACATLVMFVFLCLGYGGFFTRFLLPLFESPAGLAFQFVHELRLRGVTQLPHISTKSELEKFFDLCGIDWLLQNPRNTLSLSQAMLDKPAVSCCSYRLFHVARHALSLPTAAPVTIP